MSVIFYDDVSFPSGTAGGKMQKHFPDDIAMPWDSIILNPLSWPATTSRSTGIATFP